MRAILHYTVFCLDLIWPKVVPIRFDMVLGSQR